jgi:hypothetical protein
MMKRLGSSITIMGIALAVLLMASAVQVRADNPATAPVLIAQAQEPPAQIPSPTEPEPARAQGQTPRTAPLDEELPSTATNVPPLAVAGMLALFGAMGVRRLRGR